ncbi:unnamed protein product, partial [Musa textilis]
FRSYLPTPSRTLVAALLNPRRLRSCPHAPLWANATLAVDCPSTGDSASRNVPWRILLVVKDMKAVVKQSGQGILFVYAIMGKNGSGKRTFSKVLVGRPDYEVTGSSVPFKDQNLLEMEPEERSHVGLFMSFQTL